MKKLFVFLLVITLVLALAACEAAEPQPPAAEEPEEQQPVETSTEFTPMTFDDTVEFIVSAKTGGTNDIVARIFAQYLEQEIGQAVAVINTSGGGGSIAAHQVDDAEHDGYTIMLLDETILTNSALGTTDMPWDSFQPVANFCSATTTVLVANPASGIVDAESLVNYYNDNGPIKAGVTIGSPSHFNIGKLENLSDIEFQIIDGGSGSDKIIACMAGDTIITSLGWDAVKDYVANGDLTCVGFFSNERTELVPAEYKTFNEMGYPVDSTRYFGICVGKNTDADIVKSLEHYTNAVCENPDFVAALAEAGLVASFMGSSETADLYAALAPDYVEIASKLN